MSGPDSRWAPGAGLEASWAPGEAIPEPLLALMLDALSAPVSATPLVLIDGLSGSGKSSLAAGLAESLQERIGGGWRVLGPDLWFPGWDGLRAAQPMTARLLRALRAGRSGAYRPWDWGLSRELPPVEVAPGTPTILEGCGVITPETRPLADLAIWVEAVGGGALRRARALERDGESYRPWWDRWEAQDLARLADDRPRELADAIVLT
ncbi:MULTISPECIES: AAA family ATPase [Schaalia]|uniref:AAA family ATPase n=1 Tax=Schaalia TaxID=2529408 RepID=UPI0026E9930B|nr:AAA family ATPase [Schaalia hyovaginalis]MCI6410508.1 AAA family ATPase [Schaalia hyovaginalis]MCI6556337.1 AAA family ATPase [Schaalia hyovaginalis]MDD7553184.1 AAA family ATPase [Schaalia hyovaginalis]MDY3094322.1 AAA family ATPase [Schaalia hyovaginalis]MDY4492241.1 AAA family ATPase [Schaalia hyovaginalis]